MVRTKKIPAEKRGANRHEIAQKGQKKIKTSRNRRTFMKTDQNVRENNT